MTPDFYLTILKRVAPAEPDKLQLKILSWSLSEWRLVRLVEEVYLGPAALLSSQGCRSWPKVCSTATAPLVPVAT